MARRPRPAGIGFAGTAPVRLVFERDVRASVERVFHALAGTCPAGRGGSPR